MHRIRLELARTKDHPNGSHRHGYEFVAPLAEDGRIDVEKWNERKEVCTVHRFWEGEGDETGMLIHRRGGWYFSYEAGTADDEPILRFEDHVFREGEYLAIREVSGEVHPFVVTLVQPATWLP